MLNRLMVWFKPVDTIKPYHRYHQFMSHQSVTDGPIPRLSLPPLSPSSPCLAAGAKDSTPSVSRGATVCRGTKARPLSSDPPSGAGKSRTRPQRAWKVHFLAPTDLYLTQKAPTPCSRPNNPTHLTLDHHPRSGLTMVPLWSPRMHIGRADHDAEAAPNPATSG
jgi:hypothetical protein